MLRRVQDLTTPPTSAANLENIFPIVFKDKEVIEKIMKTKTIAMISDMIDVSFKINEKLYSCELSDFEIKFSFNVPNRVEANWEYRAILAKHFMEKDKNEGKINQYLTRLEEYEKVKYEQRI